MKKLTKSPIYKSLFGVCGGIAEFFDISPFVVRLLFIFTTPLSIMVYFILAASLTEKPSLWK